jgi:hypothetical protein
MRKSEPRKVQPVGKSESKKAQSVAGNNESWKFQSVGKVQFGKV